MADNVTANPGTGGATFASDDIGGIQYPRVKVTFGPDGTANDVDVAAPLPTRLSDGTSYLATKPLSSPPLDTDVTQIVSSVIHGRSTAGGGTFVDVKVKSSGALVVDAGLSDLASRPLDNEAPGTPVRVIGQEVWGVSFADSGASVLSSDFTTPIVGTGVTYNQSTSSLKVVAGTTTNAEFLTRSVVSWRGSLRLKFGIVSSQRIVNNNFSLLLADLVGAGLSFTINSATSVTVTAPGHTFTSLSVGQFMLLGGIAGAAGVPGRYAIASVVAGTSITFTVAGWPASGSGTLTLFGHSYVRNLFTGATATNVAWDAQRRGWATGDTTATINTTASPGTVIHNEVTGREVFLMDQLRATSTAPNVTARASRFENIPDDDLDLYVWVWNFNGTVAPASSTTYTLGFIAVEKFANTPVYVQGFRATGVVNPAPVSVTGTLPAIVGQTAEDSAVTGNPVRVGATAYDALPPSTVVNGDAIALRSSRSGQLTVKLYAPGDLDFNVNLTVITNTQTQIRAAQAANIRSNITSITYQNTSATATTLTIQDASATLITFSCAASMANPVQLKFPTPLRGTAATALNYTAGTTGANVLLNVMGYNSY